LILAALDKLMSGAPWPEEKQNQMCFCRGCKNAGYRNYAVHQYIYNGLHATSFILLTPHLVNQEKIMQQKIIWPIILQ
jgi:hypothetical protein